MSHIAGQIQVQFLGIPVRHWTGEPIHVCLLPNHLPALTNDNTISAHNLNASRPSKGTIRSLARAGSSSNTRLKRRIPGVGVRLVFYRSATLQLPTEPIAPVNKRGKSTPFLGASHGSDTDIWFPPANSTDFAGVDALSEWDSVFGRCLYQ